MDRTPWLTALSLLFLLALAVKLVPWRRVLSRSSRAPGLALDRAVRASDRAAALEAAARSAAGVGARRRAAVYFWRALRLDPTRTSALDGLVETYVAANTLRRLERVLWRALEGNSDALRDAARRHLLKLYQGPLAGSARAHAVRALALPQ